MNSFFFRYRPLSQDWIASCKLDGGDNLNFYCGKAQDCRAAGDESVPRHIELEANRLFPQARAFWQEYISEMLFFFADIEDEDLHQLPESFCKEHILLRQWWNGDEDPDGFGIAGGWIIDASGRVWESSNGDIDGWHKQSEIYPGEIWPINEVITTKEP
jgi:hypothetical protein